jgi:hypothetical protein
MLCRLHKPETRLKVRLKGKRRDPDYSSGASLGSGMVGAVGSVINNSVGDSWAAAGSMQFVSCWSCVKECVESRKPMADVVGSV